ncbi:pleckstrin homology domain-containing family D member 1-like [Hydractinia symbiolongicarpus]|uniref:pleckstrin homology domain-containing family D member 1-like n=1 Tax=Hydractinia symbiolongicarpus TaxID=13093 RepID=UPI00254BAAA6|nr:pleckstrin homology domain-containing family D member 1-like [Hydractinia symbiolongicarpus]
MNQKEKNVEVSENFKNKINQLEKQMEEMTENRKTMEQENFDRLVSSAEKEYEYSQKYKENHREYERVKNELNVAQEYLRLATDRNSELQAEHEKLRDAYEKLMGEKKNMEENFKLERKKSDEAYEKEKNQMREHAEEEKEQRAGSGNFV